MNRDFLIDDVTPATARKIVEAMKAARLYIDPIIVERAKEGMTEDRSPSSLLTQFINDHDHRCVIPYEQNVSQLREGIAKSIPADKRVIFFDDPVNWNMILGERVVSYNRENDNRFRFFSKSSILSLSASQIKDLFDERDCILVMKMEYPESSNWLSRMFPKVIAYCEVKPQFTMFSSNSITNSVLACAVALFPHLIADAKRLNHLRLERAMPLVGGTTLFLKEKVEQPKIMKNKW